MYNKNVIIDIQPHYPNMCLLRAWKPTHTSREEEVSTKGIEPRRHTERGIEVTSRGKGKPIGSLVCNSHTYNVKAIKLTVKVLIISHFFHRNKTNQMQWRSNRMSIKMFTYWRTDIYLFIKICTLHCPRIYFESKLLNFCQWFPWPLGNKNWASVKRQIISMEGLHYLHNV